MMTLVFMTIVIAAMQTGEKGPTLDKETAGGPPVFKTLNLDFPNPNETGKLIVDINRGFVEVTGHEQSNVTIEILTPPEYQHQDAEDSELKKFFAPYYDVHKDPKSNSLKLDTYNQDFVLNLRIKVPLKVDLSLDTYMDGYLEVNNVTGKIRSRSEHSDIRLLQIAGSATGRSRNGHVTAQFREVAADAILDFESYNGTVDLTLPPTIAATTAISSGTGGFYSAFKTAAIEPDERPASILAKVKSNVDEYQFGKINGGGIPLRLENRNGSIRIRKPKSKTND